MNKNKVKEKQTENENVITEDGFIEGDAYPNCDGEPCANSADSDDNSAPAVEDFKSQAEEWKDKYMRLSAEFDNYRKRTLKEKMDLIAAGGEDIIKAMLAIVDDHGPCGGFARSVVGCRSGKKRRRTDFSETLRHVALQRRIQNRSIGQGARHRACTRP